MWWKFRVLNPDISPGEAADRLLSEVDEVPVPMLSLANRLGIKVTVGDYNEPRVSCTTVSRSAKIRIPAEIAREETRKDYLIASGIGNILFRYAFSEDPSMFADTLLVPSHLLEDYGERADWDARVLAGTFKVSPEVMRRRILSVEIAAAEKVLDGGNFEEPATVA